MGHLADHVKEYGSKQNDTLHYLLGAISGTIGYGRQSDSEKLANIIELVEDFNRCFPSDSISKSLRGEDIWK